MCPDITGVPKPCTQTILDFPVFLSWLQIGVTWRVFGKHTHAQDTLPWGCELIEPIFFLILKIRLNLHKVTYTDFALKFNEWIQFLK